MATQNDADVHDTPVRVLVPSMSSGALHEVPFHVTTDPASGPIATHNDADTHDTGPD
jgi:hypothetical protein